MNFIIWLIVGGLLGWVASMIMGTNDRQGMFLNIIVGIVGAYLGGLVLAPMFDTGTINQGDFSVGSLVVSLLGAVVLLAIVGLSPPGRGRRAEAIAAGLDGASAGSRRRAGRIITKRAVENGGVGFRRRRRNGTTGPLARRRRFIEAHLGEQRFESRIAAQRPPSPRRARPTLGDKDGRPQCHSRARRALRRPRPS